MRSNPILPGVEPLVRAVGGITVFPRQHVQIVKTTEVGDETSEDFRGCDSMVLAQRLKFARNIEGQGADILLDDLSIDAWNDASTDVQDQTAEGPSPQRLVGVIECCGSPQPLVGIDVEAEGFIVAQRQATDCARGPESCVRAVHDEVVRLGFEEQCLLREIDCD